MKNNFSLLLAVGCLLPFAAHAAQIVNIDALSSTGTSVTLNAGTYEINVIGSSQGGAYNGWDYATANFGTNSATPAPNAWVNSFVVTINGVQTTYLPSGNPAGASAAASLAIYQSSVLYANGSTPASGAADTALFTIASTQTVNFKVADYLFVDNWGGTSLSLSAVDPGSATPEPSTFALAGLALAGSFTVIRRRVNQ